MLRPGDSMTLQITYVTELQVFRKREFKFLYKSLMDPTERFRVRARGTSTPFYLLSFPPKKRKKRQDFIFKLKKKKRKILKNQGL